MASAGSLFRVNERLLFIHPSGWSGGMGHRGDSSEGKRRMQSPSTYLTASRDQCWRNHPWVSQNAGSHTASFRFHAVRFKDTAGKKRALLLREMSALTAKRRLCPFSRGFAEELLGCHKAFSSWWDTQEATLPYKLMFRWLSFSINSLSAT